MSTLDEVKQMQIQGLPEDQIVKTLQDKGVPYKDISEALSQSRIKAAVEDPIPNNQAPLAPEAPIPNTPQTPGIPGMKQSLLQTEVPPDTSQETQEYVPTASSDYGAYAEQYPSYDYSEGAYGGGVSPDVITEISEQIVSEHMGELRKNYEKFVDFKISIETKTESLEERLKRIEQIINTLQTSVLRKVGDYVTNVSDIKRELIATQKSFTKLLPEIKKGAKKHTTHKHIRKKK